MSIMRSSSLVTFLLLFSSILSFFCAVFLEFLVTLVDFVSIAFFVLVFLTVVCVTVDDRSDALVDKRWHMQNKYNINNN